MKLKFLAIALFPLALVACQANNIQKVGDSAVTVLQQQNPNQILSSYDWSTKTTDDLKPLVVQFTNNGRVAISTSCNTLSGTWAVAKNILSASNIISTQMACTDHAMKQEGFAGALFSNAKIPFILNLKDPKNPTLTLNTLQGTSVVFTGKMTPETQYQSASETFFFEVSPETKKCSGLMPRTCLQVKEIKYADNGIKTQVDKDWGLFYDEIQGFEHTPNERQVIRVKRYEIKNPAADQSKYVYIHDMTVEREAIQGAL